MEVLPGRALVGTVVATAAALKEPTTSSNAAAQPVRLPILRAFVGSLLATSSPGAALAKVNYDDFVNRATTESPASSTSFPELPSISLPSVDFELPSVELPAVDFGGAVDFVGANPLALVAGAVAVAVPFIASRAFASPAATFGSVSAAEAFERLSNPEQNAQLLDIRAPEDIKVEGSPSLKSIKKKAVRVAYSEDEAFVDKVVAKFKDAENTTLYILDRFDGSAAGVAKLLANSGFQGAYAIRGGAEGPNGWKGQELPWAMPAKSFSLNLEGLKSIIADSQEDAGNLLPTSVGLAAAAGVGLVVLSEAETTLQLLGTVAVAQLFVKKFLFANDRKNTIEQIKSFLDTKIAPKEFVDEIKEVGRVLLPQGSDVKAAVATGATVIEKKLGVDAVTPEAIGEKVKEEAEKKLGVDAVTPEAIGDKVKEEAEKKLGVDAVTPEAIGDKVKEVAEKKLGVDAVTPEAIGEKVKEEAEKATAGVDISTNEASTAAPAEEEEAETPSPALPVLQEPPSLPTKGEGEEEEATAAEPVAEAPAAEASTTSDAAPEEATIIFDSDKDLKPASPFQPVAEAVSADASS